MLQKPVRKQFYYGCQVNALINACKNKSRLKNYATKILTHVQSLQPTKGNSLPKTRHDGDPGHGYDGHVLSGHSWTWVYFSKPNAEFLDQPNPQKLLPDPIQPITNTRQFKNYLIIGLGTANHTVSMTEICC